MSFTEKIFDNPGAQLKKYAIRLFWSIFISSIIIYFAVTLVMTINQVGGAVALWILSPLAILIFYGIAWFFAIRTYAFGELVENSEHLKQNDTKKVATENSSQKKHGQNNSTQSNNSQNKTHKNNTYKSSDNYQYSASMMKKTKCPHCHEDLEYLINDSDSTALECPYCYKSFEIKQNQNNEILKAKLEIALEYSDEEIDSIINYLSTIHDNRITEILKKPKNNIQHAIQELINDINNKES